MKLDEAMKTLEEFFNEPWSSCESVHYKIQPEANFLQKLRRFQRWCCGQPMRIFIMSCTIEPRAQTIFVCLSCASCEFEGAPRKNPGYLKSLQEEQALKRDFPERYREYEEYRANFAAEGICLLCPLTFREFFFREAHKPRSSVVSLIKGARVYSGD